MRQTISKHLRTKWQSHYQILQREHIVLRICQAMIAVILLQSIKLSGAPTLFTLMPHNQVLLLHIANMCVHLGLFLLVLILIRRKSDKAAKLLLPISFCSYITVACYLWHFDLNLQYYFLLSMFISCYVFDRHERIALSVAISLQFGLFMFMQRAPITSLGEVTPYAHDEIAYLENIAHVNTWVFGISCIICALFIRNIMSKNWQQLKKYEATQALLLKKLFPPEMVPHLLSTIGNNGTSSSYDKLTSLHNSSCNSLIKNCLTMGVVFLDIVDFTSLTKQGSNHEHRVALDWQSIYGLFSKFDKALLNLDAQRIKTNGDQYILLIGRKSEGETLQSIALQLVEACQKLLVTSHIRVRIGAAIGPVTCGIFDTNNPNFDIWGETVIRAARLEKLAPVNQILVDESLYRHSAEHVDYEIAKDFDLKGLGIQKVYAVKTPQ